MEDAYRISEKFLKETVCDDFGAVFCLQDLNSTEIMLAVADYPETFWLPVPDYSFSGDPLFPGEPENLLSEVSPDVEVMIGTTKDEGLNFMTGTYDITESQ